MKYMWMVIGVLASLFGCAQTDTSGELPDFLPVPASENRNFVAGWKSRLDSVSDNEAHEALAKRYNAAVMMAAESMGWNTEALTLSNSNNVATTPNPKDFRDTKRYVFEDQEAGCAIQRSNGRVKGNCSITVITGGLIASETPEGVAIPIAAAWSFEQPQNHIIEIEVPGGKTSTHTAFLEAVSTNLPNGVYLFSHHNGGQWLYKGERVGQ
ncbi:hypothetical protein PSH49_20830 [Pseudoalteromonas sp. GABNS16G]|uniref:hypothetical protein n=1 Tax=Pseudoalteromonas sp. GABNS16G TaxID=3025324 RepID=UPI002358F3CA|nr:hypothetical protein [Pseudoalteromonas sp. GABNS16G]MDC9603036.1 hypothetical protein [Pseudoalteromonas sp. GABNS16G]